MKLHLPVLLRKALLACLSVCFAYSMGSVVSAADLTLGNEDSLTIDYADIGSIPDLENGTLQLSGDTILLLSNCGEGDGKTYTLLTGVSVLRDADGNAIVFDSSNNSISHYFDTTRPGIGFWADASLSLADDGTLQMVRHHETVKAAKTITIHQTESLVYSYYEGISFEDITSAFGGAIYGGSSSTIELSGNGSVTFSENTASSSDGSAYGGAIYGYSSTITLSGNGSVEFSGNEASSSTSYAYGGAIDGHTITLSDNGSVEFSGNEASSSTSYAYGGAIDGHTITLSDNGSVEFSGNTASASSYYNAYGGAIYGDTIELSGNGSVTFSDNSVLSDSYGASGGAIFGYDDSTITLSDNACVEFSGNEASSSTSYAKGGAISGGTIELSDNGSVEFSGNEASSSTSYAKGGAISGHTITLSGNESVTFSGNTASSGGAIYGGTITLNDNESVTFSGNTASDDGGAIYADSSITLSDNGSVTFSGNTVSSSSYYAYGGAIYGGETSTITLSGNESVTFSGNTVSSSSYYAYGGAIYGSTIELCGNGSVMFSENSVSSSSYAHGGAIYGGSYSTITLSGNGSVEFSGNTASSSGGAIYGASNSTVTLSGNGSVEFSGNTASASSYNGAYGGAIYGDSSTISLTNNQQVLFEKNAEVGIGAYRLRSIYTNGTVNLSAPKLEKIRFNDSIYVGGKLALNADYTDDTNQIHTQTGEIIFSGEHTEEHLKEVKGGIAGTAKEIAASRESYAATVELYAGRLHLEHGVSLAGSSFTAVAGGASTVLLKDAAMSYTTAVFGEGTSLELEGNNSFNGSLQMTSGSTMRFILGDAHQNAGALTLNGDLTLEAGTTLQMQAAYESGVYQVMSLTGSLSGWNADTLTLVDVAGRELDNTRLYWSDNVLYYSNPGPEGSSVSWSNTGGDGLWNNKSYNWTSAGETYAYVQGLDVSFGSNPGETVTLEGDLIVRNMQIQPGGNYTFAESAKGGSLEVCEKLEIAAGAAADIQLSRGISVGQELRSAGELKVNRITGEGDVVITGGSLELADDTDALAVSGEVSISNATLKGSWTATNLSIGDSMVETGAEVTLKDVTLHSTLGNEGTLQLGGEVKVQSEGFTKWNYSDGENGYIADVYTLVTGNGNSIALSDAVWTVMSDGNSTVYDYYRFTEGNLIAGYFRHTDEYWVNSEVTYDGRSEFDTANTLVLNGGELTLAAALGDNLTNGIRAEADSSLNMGDGLAERDDSVSVNVSAGITVTVDESVSGLGTLLKSGDGVLSVKELSDSFAGKLALQQGILHMAEPLVISKGRELHVGKTDAVLDATLQLSDGLLCIDFADSGETVSLNNTNLHLQGETGLLLRCAGKEDGRVYDLFTDVYGLMDADGNALVLGADNNAAALYFDAARPGTGFWKNATLQLTDAGTLSLVRYTDISIPTGYARTVVMDEPSDFTRYAGLTQDVAFRLAADVTFDASAAVMTNLAASRYFTSDSADALSAISFRNSENRMFYVKENETLIMKALRAVTFEDMAVSADEAISGGAIYVSDNSGITLEDNGAVIFSGTTLTANGAEAQGGALYAGATSPVVLNGNGSVEFLENSAVGSSSYGGAMYVASTVLLSNNNGVIFRDNSSVSEGGAIYVGAELTLSDNGSVEFSGNTSGQGGAINAAANVVLEANGVVSFSGNEATSGSAAAIYAMGDVSLTNNGSLEISGNTASASGGAIYGSTVTVNGNQGSVVFSENTTTSGSGAAVYTTGDVMLTDNGSLEFRGNTAVTGGGAIYGSTVTVSDNIGAVSFIGNASEPSGSSSSLGGAIYGGSQVTLSGNNSVVFKENSAYYRGGAIYTPGTVRMSGNGSVEFRDNVASYYQGGAIYAKTVEISDNAGGVVFTGNKASFDDGGAIYASSIITLSGNGSVEFSKNTAKYGGGGAIWSSSTVTINNHAAAVLFRGNTASSSTYGGGAVYARSGVTLSHNGSVDFAENSTAYRGGAVYTAGSVTLIGNDEVTFAGNVEKSGSTYRLRGLYLAGDSSTDKLTLSAGKGQSICFYDSIYMGASGSVELNADYQDADGVTQKASGTILFSGATTEDDLKNAKNGVAGTEEEILNSRTSELNCATTLYGGTLQVQNAAALNLSAMTIAKDAQASIEVSGGSAMTASGQVSVATGGTAALQVQKSELNLNGGLTVTERSTATMQVQDGSAFNLSDMTIAENAQATWEVTGGSAMTANGQVSVATGGTAALQVQKSELNLNGGLTVAAGSTATMQVQDGSVFNLSDMTIAENAQATLEVTGGSSMTASGQVNVAAGGLASLKVQNSKVNWEKSSLALSAGNRIELQDNAEFNLSAMTIAENAQASIKVSGGSAMTSSGQVSVAAGGLASLKVQESEVNLGSNALVLTSGSLVELQNGASLSLSELTVAAGAELKAGGYIAPVAVAAGAVAFSLEGIESDTPIVNTGSVNHLAGNLRLSGGSTLNLQDSYLTVSGDLVLDVTSESEKVVVELMPGIAKDELSQVVLFEVGGAVTFGENGTASDSEVVYYQFAEDYFTGDWISQDTWLVYDRSTNLVYLEGVNIISVPEPTSSLLGLVGLVAFTLRRRRK